ncbi:hypothetical protein B0F90DRAFT_1680747 [Multifurca ochricompacta]|uniref:Ion transport domain-containing protein n=1 Tax=Multifurca ochricompacta TaxID=376703 RepID=A0AAD4QUE8_9AGAM|nr:hypothetical protein B0F90DRAFT_1680747 [Multifurca ochricompacta]
MSRRGDDDDLEASEHEPLAGGYNNSQPSHPKPARSIHAMTRDEIRKGIANRVIHSRTYILLYLLMAGLSITTVVLSLREGCPGLAFYILEVIINSAMIAEVAIRFLAFGRQFWKYPFNVFDLVVTVFCVLTLLVILFAGCGATSREEEIFDTLLLVTRNVLQFGRLANIVRQSGQSIFAHPKPIDLSAARRAGVSLDMDLDFSDDEESDGLRTPLYRNPVLFDSQAGQRSTQRGPTSDMPRAAQAARERDEEDIWAELG